MRNSLILTSLLIPWSVSAQNTFHRVEDTDFGQIRAFSQEMNGKFAYAARWEEFGANRYGTQVSEFDQAGNMQWAYLYRSPGAGSLALPNDIVAHSSGGYAVVGETGGGTSADSSWIWVLDDLGDTVLVQSFGSPLPGSLGTNALRVAETANGDLLVGGEIDVLDTALHQDLYIARISASTGVVWSKHIASQTVGDFARFGDFLPLSGGSFLFTAQSTSDGCILGLMDDNGDLVWANAYDTNSEDLRAMAPFSVPNGYRIPLRAAFPGVGPTFFTLDTDPNGFSQGGHSYRITTAPGSIEAVAVLSDKSFVAGGTYGNAVQDMIMLRGDPQGIGTWARRYGSAGQESGTSITVIAQKGNYVLGGAGELSSLQQLQGGIPSQPYWVQTDGDGTSGGCEDTLTVVTDSVFFASTPLSLTITDMLGWAASSLTREMEFNAVDVCPELGVQGTDLPELTLAPNPSSDRVFVSGLGSGSWQHRLFDARGRQVLQRTSQGDRLVMDVSDLPPGPYLLQSSQAHGQVTNQLVITGR